MSLLTLRLSSPSFLETILTDAGQPVYSTETYENSTSLSRCDPVHGLSLVASIRWPEHVSPKGKCKEIQGGAQVLMDGGLKSEDDLLKRNVFNTSRKFHIPGHSHSLKWKRVQGVFQCTSNSGTPVAVFEPAILTARARLNIFVPSLNGLPDPQGSTVSTILVDYLIVTALLLLTHPEDWRGFEPSPVMATLDLPHLQIPQSPRAPSYSTPVSPIAPSFSDSSSNSGYPSAYSEYEHGSDSCRSATTPSSAFSSGLAEIKEDITDYEPPPPYEEIQWTVRVRQPRRPDA